MKVYTERRRGEELKQRRKEAMKKIFLAISIWLLGVSFISGQTSAVSGQNKDVAENKDSTELVQLTKQRNDLNMKIVSSKASLHDRKKQIEIDEKNLDLMEIDLRVTEYAIMKQKELIEAKKSKK